MEPDDHHEYEPIDGYPGYMISRVGDVFNLQTEAIMRPSVNNHGLLKISLLHSKTGDRHTIPVGTLVGKAFLPKPTNRKFSTIVYLDGDQTNVHVDNLVWRPAWFSWAYTNQRRGRIPAHYKNLPVTEYTSSGEFLANYDSVVAAAVVRGVLFRDVWASMNTEKLVFPHFTRFERSIKDDDLQGV